MLGQERFSLRCEIVTCVVLAVVLIAYAWNFDYHDKFIHSFVAIGLLACSVFKPRFALVGLTLWFLLIGVARFAILDAYED